MNTLIIYFTGTFNTRYLVNKIKDRLFKLNSNYHVDTLEVNKNTLVKDLSSYNLIIFSYPIYAFNTPSFYIKYLKKLKFYNNNVKYIITKQSGETFAINNASNNEIYNLLRFKFKINIKNINEYHFILPYNIHFKFNDNFVKEILNYNIKLLEIMIYDLTNDITNIKLKTNIIYNFISYIFRIQRLGGYINSYFYKVNYAKCSRCYKCINLCPINNIVLDKKTNKIKFNNKCLMCMRCSFYCPNDAINIGLLNSWKVNGKYDLTRIEQDDSIDSDYIFKQKKFFFKGYYKVIRRINERYKEIINNSK